MQISLLKYERSQSAIKLEQLFIVLLSVLLCIIDVPCYLTGTAENFIFLIRAYSCFNFMTTERVVCASIYFVQLPGITLILRIHTF